MKHKFRHATQHQMECFGKACMIIKFWLQKLAIKLANEEKKHKCINNYFPFSNLDGFLLT
jgi:hypothetical protein